jgi:hypothetical protein
MPPLGKNAETKMKMIDGRNKQLLSSSKEMEELRKELYESYRNEHSWRLEALDRILASVQLDPTTFRRFWIQPLQAAGLSFEAAVARVVDSYFQPN